MYQMKTVKDLYDHNEEENDRYHWLIHLINDLLINVYDEIILNHVLENFVDNDLL